MVEQITDVHVPQIMEEIGEVAKIVQQARIQQHTVEEIVDVLVPQFLEESVEVVKSFSQEHILCRDRESSHFIARSIKMTQIRNVLRKWHQNQGSTVFILTSTKTEIAKYACETKMTRAPCRRRTGEAVLRAGKFGDLIMADHKVLTRKVNLETIPDTQSWYKILPLNGFNLIRVKQNFSGNGKVFVKILGADEETKVIYTDSSLEFGKSCEESSWNHCTSTPQIRNKWDC